MGRPISPGTVVTVRAWWTVPKWQPVTARIVAHQDIGDIGMHYTVEPQNGNPHHRWVKFSDVQDHDLQPQIPET